MDGMYGFHSTAEYSDGALLSPENLILPSDYQTFFSSETFQNRIPLFVSDELFSTASAISETASIASEIPREEDFSALLKAKIVSHPSYPRLLQAYIDCQKVNIWEKNNLLLVLSLYLFVLKGVMT